MNVLTRAPEGNHRKREGHQYGQFEDTHGWQLKHNTVCQHYQLFDNIDTCFAV